jgi:hypothetical protein
MPKIVRMPKLKEVPIHAPGHDRAERGYVGWFLRGFAAAVLLFGGYLALGGYLNGATAAHDEARTIIVGK